MNEWAQMKQVVCLKDSNVTESKIILMTGYGQHAWVNFIFKFQVYRDLKNQEHTEVFSQQTEREDSARESQIWKWFTTDSLKRVGHFSI